MNLVRNELSILVFLLETLVNKQSFTPVLFRLLNTLEYALRNKSTLNHVNTAILRGRKSDFKSSLSQRVFHLDNKILLFIRENLEFCYPKFKVYSFRTKNRLNSTRLFCTNDSYFQLLLTRTRRLFFSFWKQRT